jgi:isopenicillin-N epimerase
MVQEKLPAPSGAAAAGPAAYARRVSAPTPAELRHEFLLDPDVAFLNHGSFGACPRPVLERYQAWQRDLEREPVDFTARRLPGLLAEARAALASFLGASSEDLAFVPNATTAVNLAARSLDLRPGDEVLATDLEYGACDLAWEWACARAGARYVRAETPGPPAGPDAIVRAVISHAGERTRALFVSHVTSADGLVLPVAELVAEARAAGLVTVVDGAHGPAHVPLDLDELGADLYAGNCHKWLCSPKGAGFLHARPEHHERIDAAVVGWGYEPGRTFSERIELQGTRDTAAWLSVPAAIAFQAERDWDAVRSRCRELALETRDRLCELLGTEACAPGEMLAQMATVRLPRPDPQLSDRLFTRHRIEIPVVGPDHDRLRLSVAAYTTEEDVERLLSALAR